MTLVMASCSEWDDHFEAPIVGNSDVVYYNGDVANYIQSAAELSTMADIYVKNGVLQTTSPEGSYTLIVADNAAFAASSQSMDDVAKLANYTISDAAVAPSLLANGYGIQTRSGKTVWVYKQGDNVKLDDYNIVKTVKANNGYIYYVDGVMSVRESIYETLKNLDDSKYSTFKELVKRYEEDWFNREASAIKGVNQQGQVVYDSVIVTRNTLMDRYNENGVETWNMRDEAYNSTMFVPTNEQIENAINTAMDNIPLWLNRKATAADREKFEAWIVKACFVDSRLSDENVAIGAPMLQCVGGCQRIDDQQTDLTSYKSIEPAYWLPSVQTVDASSKELKSNGVVYYTTNLKIPNHIVIYRVKSRFYELWNNMSNSEKDKYFKWTNWQNPMVIDNCQGAFTLSEQLPTMYYHELTAEPTPNAIEEKLPCSVEYCGLTFTDEDGIKEVNLPAGEYYLRMGFKHSLTYSISIWFKGFNESDDNYVQLKENMVLSAQGSSYHFDRGAASEVPHYGMNVIAYPEGFDVDYWMNKDPKAIAYDTDGYTVGIVKLNEDGNFKIKVSSPDMASIYTYTPGDMGSRTSKNIQQLMMYHWCLRPTINNY